MERPTFFTKVWRSLRELTTTKGFSVKQIAKHLRQLRPKRNLKDIKVIVEQSLRYGVQNKILLEKLGKYHLSASKLQFTQNRTASEKMKKKRVRFKKGKTNINEALKNSRRDRRNSRTSRNSRNTRNSRNSRNSRSIKSRRVHQGKKLNDSKNIETSSEKSEETKNNENYARSPEAKKSNSNLIVEKKNSEEPLDVTPEKDVHGNCVNKNRIRNKEPIVPEPPGLESDTDIGWYSPRPKNKITRKKKSEHLSKVRKNVNKKYKYHSSHGMERRKHLKDFIPDDKSYRKHKTRSRHTHASETSEGRSEYDSNSKERPCSKCHHHSSSRHCNRSLCNTDNYLLERKTSNTILDHLNKSKTALEAPEEKNPTPFDVFLGANQLETITENSTSDENDPAGEIENKAKDRIDASYIN